MKRRNVSVSLSAAALLILLTQAEASADVVKKSEAQGKQKIVRGRKRVLSAPRARRVVSRRQSRMRERARLVEPLIMAAAIKYRVDPLAIWVIAYNETRFRWWLVSPRNARGMMQFIPGTAKDYGLSDPFNVPASIDAAARYVRNTSRQFDGRLDLILASYNAGPAAVEAYLKGITIVCKDRKVINPRKIKTGGIPPYSETRRYVAQGLKVYGRVRAASVFRADELARTTLALIPQTDQLRSLVANFPLNDRELDELGGPQSPMIAAGLAQPGRVAGVQAGAAGGNDRTAVEARRKSGTEVASASSPAGVSEEVFFDVHSGIRYLVRGGEIVKAIERVREVPQAEELQNNSKRNTAVVAKSSFYGSVGE